MGRLWLLAQFIAIHRLRYGNSQDPQFLRALSYQLSRASEDIIGRLDSSEAETLPESQEDAPGGSTIAVLPSIIKDEISSLVNQESITGLLAKFNMYVYLKETREVLSDCSAVITVKLLLSRPKMPAFLQAMLLLFYGYFLVVVMRFECGCIWGRWLPHQEPACQL